MATNQLRRVIQTLRGATLPSKEAGLTDGQLLECYVRSREEAAFAALVRRHGPMVWDVCRRVLGSHHDAEDAFQATFLVLVRKAASVVPREKVANYLYGVAHQTALYARATAARRGAREKQVTVMPDPAISQQELWDDLQPLLDQELRRLPDKYRAVIVLCDLEGKTRKEAAQKFNLPEGTVASRLATARAMLAKRLRRQGLAVSGGALAAVLAQQAASASVPLSVASSTIKAASLFAAGQAAATGAISAKAVALAEGVLKTMLLTKLKIATAVLAAVVLLGAGTAALTQQVLAEKPADQPVKAKAEPAHQPVKAKQEGDTRPRVVSGVVKAVDAEKHSLTVAHKEGEVTYTVMKDAHISIDGKPGELTGLPAGANVTLCQFLDQRTARSIEAGGASVFGRVKAVDAEKSTITVTGHPDDRTFRVAADTVIVIDGKPGTLARIPTGASLHALNLCVDQQTARSMNVEGPGFHHVPVKAVDAEKSTLTFDDKAPAEVAGKTFTVPQDADVRIDGQPGKLPGVPAGAFVNLVLSVDLTTARRLDVEGPHLGDCGGSMVKAVDAEKSTITFDDKASAEVAGKTFPVARDANIAIDGKPGTLAGLPAGSFVNVILSVDQSTARQIHAQGPPVSGVVKAVDAEKNTVTLADRTFRLAPDAVVLLDGQRRQLAGLPIGANVTLRLQVDQQTVGTIHAKAP